MRGMRSRKLVTMSEYRRRRAVVSPSPPPPGPLDPSEMETAEYPALRDSRVEVEDPALEAARIPSRSTRIEPMRTDWEERYRA